MPETLQQLMRRLAEIDAGELPLISAYLDVRPEATGERPALRAGLVVLRDRLREVRGTLGVRGPAVDSFEADAARIASYVEGEMNAATEGLAIFACQGLGLFETVEAPVQFENQVSVGPRADLFQLARLLDEQETAVVAVVDTNTARLFVSRRGRLSERPGPDDDPESYRRTDVGGWSQARYQRHIDEHRREFAEEIARAIGQTAERERAAHIIVAGNETAMRWLDQALEKELPPQVRALIRERLQIDMRAPLDEVAAEVAPVLRQIEQDASADVVRGLIAEVRRGGLGVLGSENVRRALERGQADVVVIGDGDPVSDDLRAELAREAALTGARVEVVAGNEQLRELGGVGALLRWAG